MQRLCSLQRKFLMKEPNLKVFFLGQTICSSDNVKKKIANDVFVMEACI